LLAFLLQNGDLLGHSGGPGRRLMVCCLQLRGIQRG
jgi:hypothetical protein